MIYQALTRSFDGGIFVQIRVVDGVARIQATGTNEIILVPEGHAVQFEIGAIGTPHDVPIMVQAFLIDVI